MILHAEDALKLSSVLIDGTPLIKLADRRYGGIGKIQPADWGRNPADWFEHHE